MTRPPQDTDMPTEGDGKTFRGANPWSGPAGLVVVGLIVAMVVIGLIVAAATMAG